MLAMCAENEVILEGYVYDLEGFAKVHPGGKQALNIFGGTDATIHYHMLHHHMLHHTALQPYKLRKADIVDQQYTFNSVPFRDLKQQIKRVVPYPYATSEWYLKALMIFGLEVFLELHSILYGFTLLKSACVGLFMALIGLCIQHDANHGAISKKGWVNTVWGLTQDWIGGSSLLWKHHHVLLHHAYTNLDGLDPDATTDIIRVHPVCKLQSFHRWQGIYTWFLLPLLPLSWHFKEIWDLWIMNHMDHKISAMARTDANIGIILRFIFLTRFYIIPLYMYPSWHTVACIMTGLAIGGMYLGVNFIISHNFEGVRHVKSNDRHCHDWYATQVETSSSVGGRFLAYFHGGLNYQIEHHLFPRICHVHYHKMQPIIQQWAKENKIRYTYFRTLSENILSCYKHLVFMGQSRKLIKI
jgi:fatty acid desaturase (delta-4 desaturase)